MERKIKIEKIDRNIITEKQTNRQTKKQKQRNREKQE
jgi:hypothetical protein